MRWTEAAVSLITIYGECDMMSSLRLGLLGNIAGGVLEAAAALQTQLISPSPQPIFTSGVSKP